MNKKQIISVLLIAFFIGALGSMVLGRFVVPYVATFPHFSWLNKLTTSSPIVVQRTQTVELNEGVNLIDLVKQAGNITVGIYSKTGQRLGSGLVVTSDGLIFTSTQVIGTNMTLQVILNNGTNYQALVRATDPKSSLAILTIQTTNLGAAQFDSAYDLTVSQRVIALGANTAASGYVTAAAGSPPDLNQIFSSEAFSDNLGTDITPTWDMIGGPVIDLNGRVVGLEAGSRIILGDELQSALNSYLKDGKINRPYLGLNYENLSIGLATIRGLPQAGIVVDSVDKGSPAAAAGFASNDLITGIDGQDVNKETLEQFLNQHVTGPMQFKVLRAGQEVDLTATLTAK